MHGPSKCINGRDISLHSMHWLIVEKMQWKALHCNGRHPSCTTLQSAKDQVVALAVMEEEVKVKVDSAVNLSVIC